MSTYNGEKYLKEQLDSIIAQEKVETEILVRDDGSTDWTQHILNEYQQKGLLTWYRGRNLGPAKSFMDLLNHAPHADYYAFSDQDDVWMKEKLFVATSFLSSNEYKYSMYISETQMVDELLNPIKKKKHPFTFTFGESLITNPAIGCTMVINKQLKDKVLTYNPHYLHMHDLWIYKICLFLNGFLYYDPNPYINYRQHRKNLVGGKRSFKDKFKRRVKNLLNIEKIKPRYETAKELYKGFNMEMDIEKVNLLKLIVGYKKNFRNKIKIITDKNLKIKSPSTKFTFVIAILIHKF